jgi:hypothetical protein
MTVVYNRNATLFFFIHPGSAQTIYSCLSSQHNILTHIQRKKRKKRKTSTKTNHKMIKSDFSYNSNINKKFIKTINHLNSFNFDDFYRLYCNSTNVNSNKYNKKRQMEMKKNRSSEDGRSEDVHSQVYCQGLR